MHCTTCRLVPDRTDEAALNMAVDVVLAGSGVSHDGERRPRQPVVRFYGWHPPAVSIGYRQPLAQINTARCGARGYAIVRRPTGGGAVVHEGELTYAIVLPRRLIGRASPAQVYDEVHAAFALGLRRWGISADLGVAAAPPAPSHRQPPASCFAAVYGSEISLAGYKVIGSAQRRFPVSTLVQGSILLHADAEAYADVLTAPDASTAAVGMQGLADLSPQPLSRAAVRAALLDGLTRHWDVKFVEQPLDPAEEQAARVEAAERFRLQQWTARR